MALRILTTSKPKLRGVRRLGRDIFLAGALFVPLKLTLYGQSIVIPSLARGQPLREESEHWLTGYLATAMKSRPGAFLDVGANIGQTLLKVKSIDWNVAYVGFEPNFAAAHFVDELIKVNRMPNCILIAVGLSQTPQLLPLYNSGDYDSAASLVTGFREAGRYTSEQKLAATFNGDEAVEQLALTSIGVVKIDVEGGEWDVLTGMNKTIERFRPIIFCEVLPTWATGDTTPPMDLVSATASIGKFRRERKDKIENALRRHSYVIFRFSGDRSCLSAFDRLPDDGLLELSDYVFVPRELNIQW